MSRLGSAIKNILNGMIIAGVMVLVIGLYYWMIKAGIPYQDPTEELRIQYAINMGIGDALIRNGFKILILGVVCRLVMLVLNRREAKGIAR
ncbi:hypothetical protein [Butyrivibrio sp. AE3004]|uniref:hypothetical protein n=1 Tax=Butyrivibrio sp. AE3004 TaxID=1506994 RepID=UPI0004948851|nr:hypothetical protein [Butyrivibrio sp. AE3004]